MTVQFQDVVKDLVSQTELQLKVIQHHLDKTSSPSQLVLLGQGVLRKLVTNVNKLSALKTKEPKPSGSSKQRSHHEDSQGMSILRPSVKVI